MTISCKQLEHGSKWSFMTLVIFILIFILLEFIIKFIDRIVSQVHV